MSMLATSNTSMGKKNMEMVLLAEPEIDTDTQPMKALGRTNCQTQIQ